MRSFILKANKHETTNQLYVVLNLNTVPPWFNTFTNYYFDIIHNKDNHGYSKSKKDIYEVAIYCRNKLHISPINLYIEKPEIIQIM